MKQKYLATVLENDLKKDESNIVEVDWVLYALQMFISEQAQYIVDNLKDNKDIHIIEADRRKSVY